ncbi:hypothetical protein MBLNU459_g7701t2 [Dothideomycetes sp. NU459]
MKTPTAYEYDVRLPNGQPSRYNRDRIITVIKDFCKFIATLPFIQPGQLRFPPQGGWANINQESMAPLGKTDEVIQLLKSLPYFDVTGDQTPRSLRKEYLTRLHNDGEAPGRDCVPPFIDLPPWVISLTTGHVSAGDYLLLDTSDGNVALKTTAKTDVWRKPPSLDVFNAPFMYKSIPISRFKRARVSAIGEWNTSYDQGGLMIVLPSTKSRPTDQKRWIKTGIEYYHGRPMMSVVAADLWADWSLLPLPAKDEKEGRMSVVVEREKEEGDYGSVLKIMLVEKDNETPIREVTWAFHDLNEDEEMWVGMVVAKPTTSEKNELVVEFEGFTIETRD